MEQAQTKTKFKLANIGHFLFLIILLYISKPVLIPLLYGLFVAIILYPLCRKLESKGWNRSLSIFAGLFMVSLLFSLLILIIVYQFSLFQKDLPSLILKLEPLLINLLSWLTELTGISLNTSNSLIQNLLKYSGNNMGAIVSSSINSTFNLFFYMIIIPVYAALILNYRSRLVAFLISLTHEQNKEQVQHILAKTIKSYSNYIKGMFWVYIIVGVLNSLGLLILGVKHAILFGMITAVMTIIPYFGIIISSLLPISIAWLTTNSLFYPLGVIFVFSFVQYLEGNFIYPYVVGKRVNVNILISIISVFVGGLLWGVSGMILFLPLIAVLKIVSEELIGWEPISILLGDKSLKT